MTTVEKRSMRPTLTVDTSAVHSNINTLRRHLGSHTQIMGVVKANGYGTGAEQMATVLADAGVDMLGIAHVAEGWHLRHAGITLPLFVIGPSPAEAAACVELRLDVPLSDMIMAQTLHHAAQQLDARVNVHLHLNTGMGRFGCTAVQLKELEAYVQKSPHLDLIGIMTHPSCAEDPAADDFTRAQHRQFMEAVASLDVTPPLVHLANTAYAQRFPHHSGNLVRIGIGLFGLQGSSATAKALPLTPAVALSSTVVHIDTLQRGQTVSYGRTYTVQTERERIATVAIGYADGLHRAASGKIHARIRNQLASSIGRICMDFSMFNVTDIPDVQVGDEVVIFDRELPAEKLATASDTVIHEVMTSLSSAVQQQFVYF